LKSKVEYQADESGAGFAIGSWKFLIFPESRIRAGIAADSTGRGGSFGPGLAWLCFVS
jgi:hypothetical protein